MEKIKGDCQEIVGHWVVGNVELEIVGKLLRNLTRDEDFPLEDDESI